MGKQIIAIDIDDVLVPRVYPVMDFLNRRFSTSFAVADMVGESFFGYVCRCFADHTAPEELSSVIEDYLLSDEYRSQKPIPGASETLGCLSGKYRLRALSTRPKVQHLATRGWLEEYFSGVFDSVVLINEGHFGFNDTKGFSKASFCVEYGIDLLMDDRLQACLGMAEVSLQAILFGEYPWNQTESLPTGVVRCIDWPAVGEYLYGRTN